MKGTRQIVIASTSYAEYDRRMQRIAAALANAGYSVTWISRARTDVLYLDNIVHKEIQTSIRSGPFFYLEFNLRLLYHMWKSQARIIYAVDLDTICPVAIVSSLKSKVAVFDAHELFYEVPELIGKPLKKWIWKAVARVTIPRMQLNLTVNTSLKNYYTNRYKTEFHTIRNVPVSLVNFRSDLENKRIICYQGVLNKGRGLELAIEAMSHLEGYVLWLIGDGDITAELKKLAKEKSLENRIQFFGYLTPETMNAKLAKASIGLNILDARSENYRLSLANKFFDYMHLGIPSINMNFPEYKLILESCKTGLVIDKLDLDAYLDAVRALESEMLYGSLVDNCRRARKIYNWDHEKKSLISLFQKLP